MQRLPVGTVVLVHRDLAGSSYDIDELRTTALEGDSRVFIYTGGLYRSFWRYKEVQSEVSPSITNLWRRAFIRRHAGEVFW